MHDCLEWMKTVSIFASIVFAAGSILAIFGSDVECFSDPAEAKFEYVVPYLAPIYLIDPNIAPLTYDLEILEFVAGEETPKNPRGPSIAKLTVVGYSFANATCSQRSGHWTCEANEVSVQLFHAIITCEGQPNLGPARTLTESCYLNCMARHSTTIAKIGRLVMAFGVVILFAGAMAWGH